MITEDIVIVEDQMVDDPFIDDEKTKNKFDPTQKRDKDGKWTDGSIGVDIETGMGKVVFKDNDGILMSRQQADDATKHSVYKNVLYHGTSHEAASAIKKGGFESSEGGLDTRLYGDGIYFTDDKSLADSYATNRDKESAKVIGVKINAKSVYDEDAEPSIADLVNDQMVGEGVWDKPPVNPTFEQFKRWHEVYRTIANEILDEYDAIIIPADNEHNGMVVVKDPSIVKIFEVKDV